MLIQLTGLPQKTKYFDVKALLKQQFNIHEYVLDNLTDCDDGTRRVRVGVTNDEEGYNLIKRLDGFCLNANCVIKAEPVRSGPISAQNRQNFQPQKGQNKFGNRQQQKTFEPRSRQQKIQQNDYRHGKPEVVSDTLNAPFGKGSNARNNQNNQKQNWSTSKDSEIHRNTFSHDQNPKLFGQQVDRSLSSGTLSNQIQPNNRSNQNPSINQFSGQQHNTMDMQTPKNLQRFPRGDQMEFNNRYNDNRAHPVDKHVEQGNPPELFNRDNYDRLARSDTMNYAKSSRFSPRRTSPSDRRVSPNSRSFMQLDARDSFNVRRDIPSTRPVSPNAIQIPANVRVLPSGARILPSGRQISPPARRMSPSDRRISPSRNRFSPSSSRRRISSPVRSRSPFGRCISPSGRRVSPFGSRISPDRITTQFDRKMSPSGRRISPGDQRINRRREPPHRMSPGRRLSSPSRPNMLRSSTRFSPLRHLSGKPIENYENMGIDKPLRSGGDGPQQAQIQAMSSGYYRKNEDNQYEKKGIRQERSTSRWQSIDEKTTSLHRSRSPFCRDRSPIRDQYSRHSNSPASHSPHRSWALEKHHSPDIRDAPPPPMWPGPSVNEQNLQPKQLIKEPVHVWQRDSNQEFGRNNDETINLGDIFAKEQNLFTSKQREPKFSPRDNVDDRRGDYRQRDLKWKSINTEDLKKYRNEREDEQSHEFFRREEPQHSIERKIDFSKNFDKDIEEVYKRAVEFRKKTEEMRSSMNQRKKDFARENESQIEKSPRVREDSPDRFSRFEIESESRHKKRMRLKDSVKTKEDFTNTLPYSNIKIKRDKAVSEIAHKIIEKHTRINSTQQNIKFRIMEELKIALSKIILDMFGNNDVSFIEIIIKYQSKFNEKDEMRILRDVLESLGSDYKNLLPNTHGSDANKIRKKKSRFASPSPKDDINWEQLVRNQSDAEDINWEQSLKNQSDAKVPDWTLNNDSLRVVSLSRLVAAPIDASTMSASSYAMPMVQQQLVDPQMIPQYTHFTGQHMAQYIPSQSLIVPVPYPESSYGNTQFVMQENPNQCESDPGENSLFLCKDDFEPINEHEADCLRSFLVSRIIRETEKSHGWAPDITLKGLQSVHRYEMSTQCERSKEWLLNLNLTEFVKFSVLMYSKEELWYERAAIWLPGHSKGKHLEPLEKLRLQNRQLEGVNIDRWKSVKKIVTLKGTRLYVDMPPSSARALENHKMLLSYEFQKVSVFLKAIAIDKDAFNAGLREPSITDPSQLASAIQNSPMPSLPNDPSIVKITLQGWKTMNIGNARKIKDCIAYHIFKYHQGDGKMRTDFLRFGFVQPKYFGIEPENSESKKWLRSRYFGKIQRHNILVEGGNEDVSKYFKVLIDIPSGFKGNLSFVFQRLKQSNRGVKGLNFNLWKRAKVVDEGPRPKLEVYIDVDSMEALMRLKFKLDYLNTLNKTISVSVICDMLPHKLMELVKKYKSEMTDSYDVANMEIDSDDGNESSSDVICLD